MRPFRVRSRRVSVVSDLGPSAPARRPAGPALGLGGRIREACASVENGGASVRKGPMSFRRLGASVLAVLLCSCVWTASAPGQSASSDSTARGSGSGWPPHGNYQTSFNVNRTVSTLTQTFSTPYDLGKLSVNTNVSYTYSTDSNNDRRTNNRLARTSFKYNPLEGLRLGMSFDITRTDMTTPDVTIKTKTDRDKFLLTGDYEFSPLSTMTTTVSAKSGSVDEFLENRTVERSGKGRNTSLSVGNSFKPWDYFTWSLNASGDFTSLDSRDSNTGLQTKDKNSTESYGTTVDMKPSQLWGVTLSARRVENQFQYPKQDAQETKTGESNSGDLAVSLRPIENLSLQLSGSTQRKIIDFSLETIRSTLTETDAFEGIVNYEFLGGTSFESRMSWENERSEYGSGPDVPVSVTSQAGYLYTRKISGSVKRSLSDRLEGKIVGNISLRSYQFDDKENNPDDRDMLNYLMSADLTYEPAPKYTAGLGLSKRVNRLVYVKAANSSNNRENETYTISANLNYKRNRNTSISQTLRLSADYSFYEYSKSKDFLIRSSDLHTIIRTRLMGRIGVQLTHSYRFQDQGGVTRTGNTVTYGRTGDNDRHDMTILVDYTPVEGVRLEVSQRLQDDKRFTRDVDGVRTLATERERVELEAAFDVKYEISDKTAVDGRFERIDSTVEGRYWMINAVFKRTF